MATHKCNTILQYAIKKRGNYHAFFGKILRLALAVIACDRAFWLFHETANAIKTTQSGTYLYCGDTAKNTVGDRAVYLKHTGGSWGIADKDRYDIFIDNSGTSAGVNGKLFNLKSQTIQDIQPKSFFGGTSAMSARTLLSPVVIMSNNEIWALPAFSPSTMTQNNYELIKGYGRTFVNHSTATKYAHNFFVPTDYWEF